MKNLKSLLLGAAVVFSFTLGAQNQEAQKKKKNKVLVLTEQLELTKEQQAEVELIFQEVKKERQVLKSNEALTPEEKKKAAKELREKTDAKFQAALTKEQYVKYTEMKAEKREDRKKGALKNKDAMYDKLGLNEAQRTEMESLNKKIGAQKKSIKSSTDLSEDEKKTALKELSLKRETEVKSILTDDQYKKLEEIKKKRKVARGKTKERKHK